MARKMSDDGKRRYALALALSKGDKRLAPVAIIVALSKLGGLMPYESETDEKYIKQHLPMMVLSRMEWDAFARDQRTRQQMLTA